MKPLQPLTTRESQVAELLDWGAIKKEIALRLRISIHTVNNINTGEWINDIEAARLLQVSKKRLQNMVSNKTISRDIYKVTVNGKKYFNKQKLLGDGGD